MKNSSIPVVLSTLVGVIFLIDNVYPNGEFTPFQFLVPTTTILVSSILWTVISYHMDSIVSTDGFGHPRFMQ
ncbi:MAG TPA: hypothetical protein VK209_00460 [Candidatus Sulfotelmatobacter sp.]|nr:hypothetical protein [Candidatus Sulfotelmatobacter sp.]